MKKAIESHGKVTEPVMEYMVGKHISKDLRTYIQNNRETFKAFKLIEPLISLTKSNGNGSGQMAKQLEELKKATFKQMLQYSAHYKDPTVYLATREHLKSYPEIYRRLEKFEKAFVGLNEKLLQNKEMLAQHRLTLNWGAFQV